MRPESPLRWLDTLDGLASAARLVCAGYGGPRVLACLIAVLLLVVALRLDIV